MDALSNSSLYDGLANAFQKFWRHKMSKKAKTVKHDNRSE